MSFRPLSLLFVFIVTTSASATDYISPRAAGLGGAGHGAPILNDAIYMNPAMIALLPAYSVSVSHETAKGPSDTEPKALVENASIQDGTNALFAAGVGYTRKTYGREVHVGVASRIFQMYGVGIGGKYLFGSDSKESAQDATVSGVGSPLPWLQGGISVDNLLETDKMKKWNRYREFIFGTKFNIQKILILYLDPHVIPGKPGETFGYEAGFELPVMSDFFIRAGVNKNSFHPAIGAYGRGHGFGVGWAFPRFSLDAAITRTFEPVRTNNFLFSVTIL